MLNRKSKAGQAKGEFKLKGGIDCAKVAEALETSPNPPDACSEKEMLNFILDMHKANKSID